MKKLTLHSAILLFLFIINTSRLSAQASFITKWVPVDGSITIPTDSSATYNYEVTWKNLSGARSGSESGVQGDYTISGLTPGDTIQVEIIGTFPSIYFNGYIFSSFPEIVDISQWGDIQWQSFSDAFIGCINLKMSATDVPDLSNVKSMGGAFANCKSLVKNPAMSQWDVSNVTDMTSMFYGASSFNQSIGSWDVGNVTDMDFMFALAGSFNQVIGDWDVSNVTEMNSMFNRAKSFNQPIGKWDVNNVTDMANILFDASSFNRDISNWNVSNVIDMSGMFRGASSFNQDISSWDVSGVIDMNSMFTGASSFNQPIGEWDVGKVRNMERMFAYAESFNQDISNWDVSNVSNMKRMFANAKSFNQDIGEWNVGNVTTMFKMFKDADSFDQNLGNWDLISLTDAKQMFNAPSGVGMSCENFGKTLEGWSNNIYTSSYLILGAHNRKYPSNVQDEIDHLLNEFWWTIKGLDGTCEPLAAVAPFSQETLHVYPSPSTGQLTIKSGSQGKYSIYNIYGQLVKIGKLNAHQATRINLSDVANGIYFIRVRNRVEKIVLQ